ncbi:MAG TPA: hypothetical protein VE056_12380, partial [Pyrinomonadaceae bacterium]|nr:hypothetical protein [Pyrinomonadaceae bacterium]
MSHHLRKTSKLATMDAARELYFIVVALAILKSLELSFHELSSHNVSLYDWFLLLRSEPSLAGIAVEFAFLFTVLRYSHGISHLLAFEKHGVESSGLPSSFRILMLFVFLSALGILFFLMAYYIRDFPEFVFWMSVMFGLDFTYIAFSNVVRAPLLRFMLWFPGRVVLRWRRFLEAREKNKAGATNNGTSPPTSTNDRKIESEWINTTPGYAADAALQWMLSDSLIVIFSLLLLRYGMTYAHRQLLFAVVIGLAGGLDYWFNRQFYFGGWRDRRKENIIFVCSPFMGGAENPTESDYRKNICQAQAYCREVMKEGDIPFASHCFYPYFLNYDQKKEAILARYCSLAFLRACDAIYLYLPHKPRFSLPLLKWIQGPDMKALNSSQGMKEKLIAARRLGLRIKFRNDTVSVRPKDCWKPSAIPAGTQVSTKDVSVQPKDCWKPSE